MNISTQGSDLSFPIIESIRERDIDLLILEELYANSGFEKIFLNAIKKPDFTFAKAYRSITTAGLGETDIQVEFTAQQKKLFILIENKVDAEFQDAQYERYMKRAELLSAPAVETSVILVAPKNYIDNKSEFEFAISYEDILLWFKQKQDARSWYKSEILRLAIEQERRGYQVVKDEIVTRFWKAYYEYIQVNLPELQMNDPKSKPTSSSFVYFNPKWLPVNTRFIHKMEKGYIDLELSGMANKYEELVEKYTPLLIKDMELVITGKSVSFRLEADPISFDQSFEEQEYILEQVVVNCLKMKEFTFSVIQADV